MLRGAWIFMLSLTLSLLLSAPSISAAAIATQAPQWQIESAPLSITTPKPQQEEQQQSLSTVEQPPTPISSTLDIANLSVFKTYVDPERLYSLQYPANWEVMPRPNSSDAIVTRPLERYKEPSFIMIHVTNGSKSLQDLTNSNILDLQNSRLFYNKIVNINSTTLDGIPASKIDYLEFMDHNSPPADFTMILAAKNDKEYVVLYSVAREDLPLALKMIHSFQITGSSSTAKGSENKQQYVANVPGVAQGNTLQQIPAMPDSFKNNDNKKCSDLKNSITDLDSALSHPPGLTAEQYQTLQKAKDDYSNSGCK